MEKMQIYFFAPNLVNICIDKKKDNDFCGVIWQPYDIIPQSFYGVKDMLLQAEVLYNRWNYPQESVNSRTFQRNRSASSPKNTRKGKPLMNIQKLQEERGKKGTFIVHVQYRQNATWQGQVLWAEKNRREYFRSALELIKLIDSALDEQKMDNAFEQHINERSEEHVS